MNFLSEINAFDDWIGSNELDTTCQALWLALMCVCNRKGWPEEFTTPTSKLAAKIGITPKTLKDARNRLYQAGLIDLKSNGSNRPATYKMISLSEHGAAPKGGKNYRTQGAHEGSHEVPHEGSHGHPPIYTKQNKTKREKTRSSGDAPARDPLEFTDEERTEHKDSLKAYLANNLSAMSPGNYADLADLLANGSNEALVRHAVDTACARNANSWAYVASILNRWIREGIKTVGDAKANAEAFKQRYTKAKPPSPTTQPTTEWDGVSNPFD